MRVTKETGGVWRVEHDGRTRRRRFGSSRAVDEAASYLGLDEEWLQKCLDTGEGEYEVPAFTAPPLCRVGVRGWTAPAGETAWYDCLALALASRDCKAGEPLVYWEGTQRYCALDVDFHNFPMNERPTRLWLDTKFARLSPECCYAWVTHGRGLRFMYESLDGFDADELAASAAIMVLDKEPSSTVELKSATRHPGYEGIGGTRCSDVQERQPNVDCPAVLGWCRGAYVPGPAAIEEWLANRGFIIGGCYTHDRCPVGAGRVGKSSPVIVNEEGIYCHHCAARGVSIGDGPAGWFSYAALFGQGDLTCTGGCARNFTHWEHARFILEAEHKSAPSEVLRLAYRCLLKCKHGVDHPLIGSVFRAGRNLVRYQRRWGTLLGETYSTTTVSPILASLPACRRVEGGKVVRNEERIARYVQSISLEDLGYPYLRPVWGMPIAGHYLTPKYRYTITLFKGPGRKPVFVPREERAVEEAWRLLGEAFPGVTRTAVELLVAAKGCAEMDGTFPPFIFISGPTGSSKTTSTVLAAAICGDRVYSVPSVSDDTRIRAGIVAAKDGGSFCVFNEAVKDGARRRIGKAEAMEFALSLTADCLSHRLYVGAVEMGILPVLVWTDTFVPQELKEHAQLARRLIEIPLVTEVDWNSSMRASGLGKAEHLRDFEPRYADAADAIISDVIDRFFQHPMTFEEIAVQLGYKTLAQSEERQDWGAMLREFYDLVRAEPVDSKGRVLIRRYGAGPLVDLWNELADLPERRSSQRIKEVDWGKLLGKPGATCAITARSRGVLIQFMGVE